MSKTDEAAPDVGTEPEHILVEKDGPIARLILNRPGKHNALPFASFGRLVEALHEAEDDDDVKVIILKGNGPSFCAGHDLNDVGFVYGYNEHRTDEQKRARRPSQRVRLQFDRKLVENYMAFHYAAKPVIAQVQGWCVGAGIYLVELVDLAICADTTRFSHAEQRLAFAGNSWQLNTELLTFGPKKARELLLLGEEFDGPAAAELGLVNRSVPEADLEATVEDWAERVAHNSRDALVMGRALHHMALDSLGSSQQFIRGYFGHALATNIRFEPDEYNFFKQRRDQGTRAGFHGRDEYHGDER
jgi:enoyl-CoA hydratase